MSGLEPLAVIGCVASVVSAFHAGAELVEIMRERRADRRRKRRENRDELMLLAQQDMLQNVLRDSAGQVDDSKEERRQRFGWVFERGDPIAENELMRVVMHLQGEVIRALQIARNAENAYMLNVGQLYEFSVTDRQAALASMDRLCQRIMQSQPPPRQLPSGDMYAIPNLTNQMSGFGFRDQQGLPSDDSTQPYQTARADLPRAIQPVGESARSPNSLMTTARNWSPIPQRHTSNASFMRDFTFLRNKIKRHDDDAASTQAPTMVHHVPHDATDSPQIHRGVETMPNGPDRSNSDASPAWRQQPWSAFSHGRSQSNNDALTGQGGHHQRHSNAASSARTTSVSSSNNGNSTNDMTPSTSRSSSGRYNPESQIHPDVDPKYRLTELDRAGSAPQVVDEEDTRWAMMPSQQSQYQWGSVESSNTADLYRTIWEPPFSKSEPLAPWSPLDQPSKSNSFHGFCEGAWLTRSNLKHGLSISRKPYGMMGTVPYWQCRKCEFACRAPTDTGKLLPQTITVSRFGIRFRWLFLAKSHIKSRDPIGRPEEYTYGCIFCAAEGQRRSGSASAGGAAYGKVELLMEHIRSKHAPHLMTPEVKEKTRCITGRPAGNEEVWDINILEQKKQSLSEKVGGLVGHSLAGG